MSRIFPCLLPVGGPTPTPWPAPTVPFGVARLVGGVADDENGRIPDNSLRRHDELQSTLRQSAAVKLLQSQNAPLIQKQRVTIPRTELSEHLTTYLEALLESHSGLNGGTAVTYLRIWCDDDSNNPVYELTPDTERAIAWVEELQKSDFVGTESRFLRIFDLLQDIVTYSTEDVAARLAQLEKEKAQLQAQIDAIEATGRRRMFKSSNTTMDIGCNLQRE